MSDRSRAKNFVRPASIAEAEARSFQLVSDMQAIDAELGQRNRVDVNGVRLDDRAFHEWRGRAVAAKRFKLEEHRQLKVFIKGQRSPAAQGADPTTDMLARSYRLLRSLAATIDLEPEEQAEIDAIGHFLTHERPVSP